MPVRVGNFELVALSKASTRQVADLSDVLGSQLILAQAGNTDESNVAMLLTRTELVVTGSTLRRIPLAQVSAVEAAGLSLRDGTWIPWNPFGGDKERNQMLAAVAQAASLTAPKGASVDALATAPAPIVQARAARERGAQFLEIQLEVAESTRDVSFGAADSGSRVARGHRDILGDIEAEGWHLENVGYVFIPTGHSTRAKILGTGESVAVSGVTVGVYLFRATKPASTVD